MLCGRVGTDARKILRGGALRFRMAPTSPKRSGPGGVRALPPRAGGPIDCLSLMQRGARHDDLFLSARPGAVWPAGCRRHGAGAVGHHHALVQHPAAHHHAHAGAAHGRAAAPGTANPHDDAGAVAAGPAPQRPDHPDRGPAQTPVAPAGSQVPASTPMVYDRNGRLLQGMQPAGPNRVLDTKTGRYYDAVPAGDGMRVVR